MVRTYAFNASSQSEEFHSYKHTAATRLFYDEPIQNRARNSVSSDISLPGHLDGRKMNNESPNRNERQLSLSQNSQQNPPQNNNQNFNFAPLNQSNIYQSAFHSSLVDPVGSIVGLRILYIGGQLVYVPVEPHINFLINKQFGSNLETPLSIFSPALSSTPTQNLFQPQKTIVEPSTNEPQQPAQQQQQLEPHFQNYPNTNYDRPLFPASNMCKAYGSMPNIAQKTNLSAKELHKLELQQQIEDNRRRKELEKQKELELEQREIRKWEEYQKKIRGEEEREKRLLLEKAKAFERRNQQIYEQQKQEVEELKKEKRRSLYQPAYQEKDYSRQSSLVRNSNSFSEELEPLERPIPRRTRQTSVERRDSHENSYESRPDSSIPRQIEWWEKKPSWQEKNQDRKSAVIPTLRGKPPAVPDSQRSGYDPAASVIEHQSRPSSQTISQRALSVEADNDAVTQQDEAPLRNSAGRTKAPTAFHISA